MTALQPGQLADRYARPAVILSELDTGEWHYRWWDTQKAFHAGRAPDRGVVFANLEMVLAALLADHARWAVGGSANDEEIDW